MKVRLYDGSYHDVDSSEMAFKIAGSLAFQDAAKKDQLIKIPDEPDHNELCKREQEVLYKAITENVDLTDHVADAVNSLKICFAAVESYRKGKVVLLK